MDRHQLLGPAFAGATAEPLMFRPTPVRSSISIGSGELSTVSDGHLALPQILAFGGLPQDEAVPTVGEFGNCFHYSDSS